MKTEMKVDDPVKPRRTWWHRLLARLRSRSERMLHPGRRRRAQERVSSLKGTRSVLFICHGNIYRSPFAAERFRVTLASIGQQQLVVSSAGFVGPGRPTPSEAQQLASSYGVDLSRHRSQLVMGALLAKFDLIVVMEAGQARELARRFGVNEAVVLGDLDPQPVDARTILDPWQGSERALKMSYERVNRCVVELAHLLTGPRGVRPPQSDSLATRATS